MTMKAVAEALYLHCGHEPNIRYVSEEEFKASLSEKDYLASLDHIIHSPVCSCQKSIELLGVEPKYSILDILKEYMDYNRPA
jgi:nucleoside-diphosphate-sugar epimerase